ncbi:hypothetical protein RvY_15210-2 [Ramazzottius varieornatus]|nr:hypothetical protein RvY_15210-2 [Ramazzottius varieornatus]
MSHGLLVDNVIEISTGIPDSSLPQDGKPCMEFVVWLARSRRKKDYRHTVFFSHADFFPSKLPVYSPLSSLDLPWPHLAVSQNLYPSLNAYHALRVILVSGCRTVQTETSQDDLETSENHRPETCLPTKRPLSCPCNTLKIEVFKWCFFLPAVMVDMTSF